MDLPIDACKAPFRDKYLTEETPMFNRWFVFGTSPEGVDLSDGQQDIFTNLTTGQAEAIVEIRHAFVDAIVKVINNNEAI